MTLGRAGSVAWSMTEHDISGLDFVGMITVPADMNGPPGSANGGVAAGLLARMIDGVARVRLYSPPPLEVPMEVFAIPSGFEARVDGRVVMAASPGVLGLQPPYVTREQALAATAPFSGHLAVTCFVCGPDNTRGLHLLPGPVDGGPVHATTWTPALGMAGCDGVVRSELVWGVLDCPGAIMFTQLYRDEDIFAALGTITVEIAESITVGKTYSVVAWPMGRDGRKLQGGTALTDAEGNVHAIADQVCIAMPAAWGGSE